MTVLWIGGVAMPQPAYKGYTTRREELVKAERNVGNIISMAIEGAVYSASAGELIKHHIAWKYTLDVQWRGLTPAEKNLLMSATSGEWFNVEFIDLDTDSLAVNEDGSTSFRMYRGSGQQVTGWGQFNDTTNQFQYYDVSMSLIQK